MLTKSVVYRTLTGRAVNLAKLSSDERACLDAVVEKYRTHPEWTRFAAWWMKELGKREMEQGSALFTICDDLEARLGIVQGKASPPDYRHYLLALIVERYGSRYSRFFTTLIVPACGMLYSKGVNPGQRILGARIRNPFQR